MTAQALAEVSEPARVPALLRRHLVDVLVPVTLLYWATFLTWGTGGREPRVLTVFALLVAIAVLAVAPWKRLPLAATVLATGIGIAAFGVVATAPTGWEGAPVAASYAVAGQLFLVVAAWARDATRATAVLAVVCLAGGLQFAQGWLPWWGGGDAERMFQGTFYWHNQVGIFLAAGALAATYLLLQNGVYRLMGWFVAPLAAAGVVFSTSRGSQISLILGVLLLALLGLGRPGVRAWQLRLLGVSAVSVAAAHLLAGPPFFAERTGFAAGTAARAATLEGNGAARIDHWADAWSIFLAWPWSGAGFHSFASASGLDNVGAEGSAPTALAHNGYLQALSDGGLLLGLPVLIAVLLLLHRGAMRLLTTDDRRGTSAGSFALLLVLLLHSGMDFDWDYPSLLSLTAIVGALACGTWTSVPAPPRSRAYGFAGVVVLLLVLSATAAWDGGLDLNATVRAS